MRRVRAIVLLPAIVSLTLVSCGGQVSSEARAASSPSGRQRGPALPLEAGQRIPAQGLRPESLPHLPFNRADLLPDPEQLISSPPDALRGSARNCYQPGQNGYMPYPNECIDPGFISTYNYGTGRFHWGIDPYNGGGSWHYVYIVDEIEDSGRGGRASEWLAWQVNELNANWNQGTRPWRPYFLYFTGSWLRAQHPNYANYYACNGSFQQFIEMCPHPTEPDNAFGLSDAQWWYAGTGHGITADMRIAQRTATLGDCNTDCRVNYGVLHEFGHAALGLAHRNECASPMTYCGTLQYRFYTPTDYWIIGTEYDGYHPGG